MLDLEKLEKVRKSGGKVTARCPACALEGSDRAGIHLVHWTDSGKFACSARAGDREHRREIWRLAGIREERPDDRKLSRVEIDRIRREREEEKRLKAIAAAAERQAERVFALDWPEADLAHASPVTLDADTPDRRLMLETLFSPEDILWTGTVTESGPGHENRFRSRDAWLDAPDAGPMICPDVFKPGICSRSGANVIGSPFIIIEADAALGRKPVNAAERAENVRRNLAVIRWLARDLRWNLRAIVLTGGKSCHGWFDRPPERHIRELRAVAPALGIDASVFTPAHPVRLPGVRHEKTGRTSRLLYLG